MLDRPSLQTRCCNVVRSVEGCIACQVMSPAKTTSERVAKMRADRDALGLKRLELYAHPDDWPAIKAFAEKLARKRAKQKAG